MTYFIDPDVAEIVAGLPGVRGEVISTAARGARILKRKIHKDTGAMAGGVHSEALGSKDAWFGVSDDGALGYIYGHHNTWSDKDVAGSHVIAKTIASM